MRKILLFAALALTCGESALANENLIKIPLTRQATDYTCGAAAMQSMLGYYGEDLNESELAKILKTNDQEGTDYNEIVALAK